MHSQQQYSFGWGFRIEQLTDSVTFKLELLRLYLLKASHALEQQLDDELLQQVWSFAVETGTETAFHQGLKNLPQKLPAAAVLLLLMVEFLHACELHSQAQTATDGRVLVKSRRKVRECRDRLQQQLYGDSLRLNVVEQLYYLQLEQQSTVSNLAGIN